MIKIFKFKSIKNFGLQFGPLYENRKLLSLLLILGICICTGCKKYLDKKPNSSLVVPNTLKDLQAVLDNANYMNNNTSNYSEASTDDYFLLESNFNSQNERNRDGYRWIPFDYTWQNEWSSMYFAIYNSNVCIERIEDIVKNSQNEYEWNNVKGSALFFRSYFFLNLAWTYAKAYDSSTASNDLAIPLRLTSDFNIHSKRASVGETYARVINDAKEAATYLPDNPLHVMRPSKTAVYGLLARTYLSMRQYDSAYKYADLSLDIKNELFNFGTEIDVSASTPFQSFNKETIFYTEMYLSFLVTQYNFNALIDTLLFNSYSANDLRKQAYFQPINGYHSFKANYTGQFKFFTGIATDEMYLTRAECFARFGDKINALNDLNALLVNRHDATFVPITSITADEALEIILAERRKELLFRGLRWIEIKRLNKEGKNITPKRVIGGQPYFLEPNSDKYALPLPTDIIDLTDMPQN